MKYEIKKLWKGFASVNENIIKKCINKRENLSVIYRGETMVVLYKDLFNLRSIHNREFKSKFGDGSYKLYDFYWKPINTNQQQIINQQSLI